MKLYTKYQFQLISIGIIVIVIGCLFHKPLIGEYTFGGPDFLSPSAVHQGISSAEEEYGKYPLWLPWIFSGLPSVHSFQNISDYYFPNYFINLLKSIGISDFWNYIFHFVLAGMGIFTILIKLGTGRYSALFGGLSFALMPFLVTMVVHGHGSQMMTTAWLPWVIWAILRLYDKTNLINLSILGVFIGLQLQRAHVQIAYYTWMTAGLLIIMMLCNIYGPNTNKSKWIFFTGIGLVLGLCMAMWIYLPAMNYTPYSIRGGGIGGGTGFDYATAWSFSFGEMATFFIPSFFGFGGPTYWGNMPFTDYPNYMGIIVLTLSVIGTLFYDKKIKWFFVSTAFLALLLSFGKHFFLYQLFYDYFPYFNKFRVPAMFLILTQFSIAVLAGMGFDISSSWIKNHNTDCSLKKLKWVLGGVLIIILGLKFMMGGNLDYGARSHPELNALRVDMLNSDTIKSILFLLIGGGTYYMARIGWFGYQVLAGIIITASVLDLGIVNRQIIEPDKNSYRQSTMTKKSLQSTYLSEDEVIRFLKKDKGRYRILPLGSLGNENRWSAFQIESVMGYHPAKIFHYNQVKDKVGWNSMGVLQMLNVKYVITLEALSHPAFSHIFSGNLFHQRKYQQVNVYQFKHFMPRVFFVNKLQNISAIDLQLQTLRKNSFNPLTSSFVEHDQQGFKYSSKAKVEISHWTPDKIEFLLDVPSKQFMVISEIFYPEGWQITSHPDWEIYPVNTILRGVYIPTGSHRMVMEFIPEDIFYGSILTWSATALIIMLILSGILMRRRDNAG